MLRELRNVQQVRGEPTRRWFYCHEVDLVVWENTDGTIAGFQLAYDKHRNEHSVAWNRERGFSHYVVDDGEPMAGVNDTPFLYANGPIDYGRAIAQFSAVAAEVPDEIASFVMARLGEFKPKESV
jgi:hypothetical protein